MSVPFSQSETKENLMRAFAGESQARNRYTIAAEEARNQNMFVLEAVFTFTADQEKEHAKIFYGLLGKEAGENIEIEGTYPVDISSNIEELLRFAHHNEYEEYHDVYKNFAEKAREEGYADIARVFETIAQIEKTHGERFSDFADWLKEEKLFVSEIETGWMCLNCGYRYTGKEAPAKCPVCAHDRGYFVRLEIAPYTMVK